MISSKTFLRLMLRRPLGMSMSPQVLTCELRIASCFNNADQTSAALLSIRRPIRSIIVPPDVPDVLPVPL